ncbi:MAG: hypothetical protein JW786_08565 [Desulfobacterales bacterium]|nr:hypothetical protein [Desulfobacterales bacterium]
MKDENTDLVPSTKTETALDIAAAVGSAIPWIGGPVGSVLNGMSLGRKMSRVREILLGLASELSDFKSTVSEEYVKTEDFEELLEQTLKRTAEERSELKRHIYRDFLIDAISSPGETYDEQIRFLRTLEELQPDHLRVIRALSQAPDQNPGMMGSPNQTLRRRLPEFDEARIVGLLSQLNDLRVTNLTSLKTMMNGQGAEDLRHSITSYGQRFLSYIVRDNE